MNLIKTVSELASAIRSEIFPVMAVTITSPTVPFVNCSTVTAAVECEKYLLALANKKQRLGIAISNYYIALFPIDENRQVVGQAMTINGETADIEQLARFLNNLLRDSRIAMINR